MLNVFGNRKKPDVSKLRSKLPMTHAFVSFAVRGNGPEGRICFEGASLKTFRTTKIAGMTPGQNGVFNYENAGGRFTFSARLMSVTDDQAVFALPDEIKTVARADGSERRVEARVDTTVNGEWRFKPVGKIVSVWSKVVISDLSRSGATIMADRDFRADEAIEVRMSLTAEAPIVIDAVVKRSAKAGAKFSVVLAFKHIDEESSHVITRFVNNRMTALRNRGLA